jgi:hypothetical protein
MGISMTTIVKQAKDLLQDTMILISVGLVPVSVGLLGRSVGHNQAIAALEPQVVGPTFH